MKIAAIYARVSTGRQEQEATIESQLDEVRNRLTSDGYSLPQDNIFIDEGWSGELLERPCLDRMRDAAQQGRFSALYVYDRGRLSRKFAHQELLIDELNDKNIQFITLHDVNAATPEEKVLQAMQGVFHEYERVKIAERMRRGKQYKARAGVVISGQALYGYDYLPRSSNSEAKWVINKQEAQVIKMIFEWVANERISLYEVRKRLYDLGIKPKKRKRDSWTKGPLDRLLRCETYITGVAYYNKSQAVVGKRIKNDEKYHKVKKNSRRQRSKDEWIPYNVPILLEDRGLFDQVQAVLLAFKNRAPRNRKHDYLLTGKTYCGCGQKRVGDGYTNNHYYRCSGRVYKFPLKHECNIPGANASILDEAVWTKIAEGLKNEEILKLQAERWKKSLTQSDVDITQAVRLKDIVNQLAKEEERYIRAYGSGSLDFEKFELLKREVNTKKLNIEKEINSLKSEYQSSPLTNIRIEQICQEAKKVIDSFDSQDKKRVVDDIIDKVIIKERSEVEVWGHLTLPTLTDNMAYGPERRDSEHENKLLGSNNQLEPEPTFSEDKVIPFQFTVKMPSPRYHPMILQRDEKGRIINSKFPPLNY